MSLPSYIFFGLIAVAVFTIYMAVVSALRKDRNQVRVKQINSLAKDPQDNEYESITPLAALLKRVIVSFGFDLENQRSTFIKLGKAGFTSHSSLIYLVFFKRFVQPALLVVGAIIFIKIFFIDSVSLRANLALVITWLIIIVIGMFGTDLFLTNSAQKRSKELSRTFPEALDLILICVESGLGIDAAFARVCKEMKESHPVVASEFDRTRFEMTMMNDRIQALQNFSDRTGLGAVRSLVSSLIQAEKFGTSLIDTMRMISEEQRNDRMMAAEAKAARLPALITLPLIFFILPGLFMIILGPAYVKLEEQGGLFGGKV